MTKTVVLFSLFLILGLIFKTGKAASLISGFETLSPKERKKWNQTLLSKFVGNLLLLISIFYLILIGIELFIPSAVVFGFQIVVSLSVIIGIFALAYVNLSKKFRKP